MLDLYRSVDLDELAPYQKMVAQLDVPTLILWGQADEYIPLEYATRFARQIPGSKLVFLDGVRHFLFDDEPARCAQEVLGFLEQAAV
jgi:haloalkane dehalogenase